MECCRALDKHYYNTTKEVPDGPFTKVLTSFHNKGVTLLIGGAFGLCKKRDKLLQDSSLHAAASDAGLLITPDTDLSSLYSARNILLHEFRTTVGCSVLRANIRQKLTRIHYFIHPRPTLATATAAVFQVLRPGPGSLC